MLTVRSSLLLWFLCCPGLLLAQTNQPAGPGYPPNRFLLVVETSRAMLTRSDQMAQIIKELLNSSLARQARAGDSLGVWTFNEDLYTGHLALQEWSSQQQKSISERVVGFLQAQKYEKKARLDHVIPPLLNLVRRSPFLTVVLVCSGEESINGTPFDDRINTLFQNWRQQQQDAHAPFVVALRAQAGRLVDCAMNPAPWPVELPALPKELFVARSVPHSVTRPWPKPATNEVPPLIVIGKKHETAAVVSTAGTSNPPPSVVPPTANPPAALSQSTIASNGLEQPAKAAPASLAQPSELSKASGPAMTSQFAATPTKPAVTESPGADRQETVNPTVPGPAVQQPNAPKPVPTESASSQGSTPQTTSDTAVSIDSQVAGAQVDLAAASPRQTHSRATIIWLAVGALVAAALSAFLVWRRRWRGSGEASLITESFDRRKR